MPNLTKTTVDQAEPRATRYKLFDDKVTGFGLVVHPSGKKTWIFEYRRKGLGRAGAVRRITIGAAASIDEKKPITAAAARKDAEDYQASVRKGGDPASDASSAKANVTIAELASLFLDEVKAKKRGRTPEHYGDVLNRIVVPAIGKAAASEITSEELARLHLKWKRTPVQANRMLAIVGSMYGFAIRRKLVPADCFPARGIEKYPEESRERFLDDAELERLGQALHEAETIGVPWQVDDTKPTSKHVPKKLRATIIGPHAAGAIRLLILTGCRLREILHLRWSEVDWSRGLLLLPTSKTGKKAVVLNSAALAVLTDLPRAGDFVIAGDGDGPRRDLKRPWSAVSAAAGLKGVRLHDLRHTHASHLAGAGVSLPIIGKLLGHKQASTTQRYAHLADDPLRAASERIGISIGPSIKRRAPAEVIELERRRG